MATTSEEYLPIGEVLTRYPHFCQTQCTAWNNYLKGCASPILGRHECHWDVNKITDRINKLKMMSRGPAWWKTSLATLAKINSEDGGESGEVMAEYE